MGLQSPSDQSDARNHLERLLARPEYLGVCFSLICLLAFQTGGVTWLIAVTITLPAFGLFGYRRLLRYLATHPATDDITGLKPPDAIMRIGEKWLSDSRKARRKMACFAIHIDGFSHLLAKHGECAAQHAQRMVAARLIRSLREDDLLTRVGDGEFMLVPTPVRHLDLEICVQLAARIKSAVEATLPIEATTTRVSLSVGFCRSDQLDDGDFTALKKAARLAMKVASRPGSATIRAYTQALENEYDEHETLRTEASEALNQGQITAWFQPQVSAKTGEISGFECLARWEHPTRGTLGPANFLEALTQHGQLEQLADLMLQRALEAQKFWDQQGYHIPHVGVNFAGDELRNPMLVEKLHWELDRFDLPPNRLSIEVLETVIADGAEGTIARNVNGLANLGCYIDLDDFGTGHASISSIRRFAVSRLKIDRSFVRHVDQDLEQQKLVTAILTMAERLGIDTLAEGVETAAEQDMLTDLGCGHIQGFAIAKPMPLDQTIPWMSQYLVRSALVSQPNTQRQKGTGT